MRTPSQPQIRAALAHHEEVLPLPSEALYALPADVRGSSSCSTSSTRWSGTNAPTCSAISPHRPADRSIAEALAWLRGRAFIARDPNHDSTDAIFVTARGHEALAHSIATVRAVERIELDFHPLIERKARPQFLLGAYEQAVFVAMKAVEVRYHEETPALLAVSH